MKITVANTITSVPPIFGPSDPDVASFFSRVAAKGSAVPGNEQPFYNALVAGLKSTMGRDGTTSLWNSLDYLRIGATYSKVAALENIIKNVNATINNDYGGSFTAGEGLKGNGTNFNVATGFNPTIGTNKYIRLSACFGVLSLDDVAENAHDLGNLSSGSTGNYLAIRQVSGSGFDAVGTINGPLDVTVAQTNASGRSWVHMERSTSASQRIYVNGFRVISITSAADASLYNHAFTEFAADVADTLSAYSTKTHAVTYFGNSNIEANTLIKVINSTFLYPRNVARSAIKNRVLFLGDSMTGDETQATTSLSALSQYPIRTLSNLGSTWLGTINGNANREYINSTLVPSISSILAVEVLGGSGGQLTFRNDALTKDVIVIYAGTNDLAFTNTSSALALYNSIVSVGTQLKAVGFKVIIVGIPARNGGFLNSQTQAQFITANADYRTRMATDFPNSTAVTNVKSPNSAVYADLWIDMFADSRFQNEADTTYFQADAVHLNTTGYNLLADTYVAPAILLL